MRIAFDLDDTLIPASHRFPVEPPTYRLLAALLNAEKLRQGTRDIFRFCRERNWQVYIYTTSYRSPLYIRRLFWLYGIRLHGVINQARHNRSVTVRSTKYPPAFGIDYLIDDSEGVRIEGDRFRFKVICIKPADDAWTETIKQVLSKTTP